MGIYDYPRITDLGRFVVNSAYKSTHPYIYIYMIKTRDALKPRNSEATLYIRRYSPRNTRQLDTQHRFTQTGFYVLDWFLFVFLYVYIHSITANTCMSTDYQQHDIIGCWSTWRTANPTTDIRAVRDINNEDTESIQRGGLA